MNEQEFELMKKINWNIFQLSENIKKINWNLGAIRSEICKDSKLADSLSVNQKP